jgi:hypothetical protein
MAQPICIAFSDWCPPPETAMGRTTRAVNQTQHGIRLRLVPDRGVPPPDATWRPKGGRLWLVLTILNVVLNRLGRHMQALIVLWNDYAIGNLEPQRRDAGAVGREHPAAAPRPTAAPPNTQPPQAGPAGPKPPATPRPARSRPEPLPSARDWLAQVCRHTVVPYIGTCVAEPEMQAFVLAVPQAARHLRSICAVLRLPVPDYLKRRRTQPAAAASEAEAAGPAPPRPAPPAIARLIPDPRHAHPGWRNYVTISGQLRA